MILPTTRKTDPDYIGTCDICGFEIYRGDVHYRLPDGMLLCEEYECLQEWIKEYKEINR